jgi:serine/threonine protein kinase
VSEYVPGPSLHKVVTTEGPRAGSALERLAIGTATALVALHDAGNVHRDLTPHTVLMGPDGPRVIDFGVARAVAGAGTVTSQVVGTPAYMAPEQLAGTEIGVAVDVFAWAATVAFAATGRAPFGVDAIPAIINRILHSPPDLDGIEPPLRDLLAACLAKDPARRPSAQRILDHLVRGVPVPPPSTPADELTAPAEIEGRPRRTRRARGVRAGLAVAAALIGIAAAGSTLMRPDSRATGSVAALTPATERMPSVIPPHATTRSGKPAAHRSARPRRGTSPTPSPRHTRTRPPRRTPAGSPAPTRSRRPTASPRPTAEPPENSPAPTPKPTPTRLVELGPGHFSAYCVSLGWEWVEYRESPQPGAYCVRRKHDQTMYLTQARLDAGCRWRFDDPTAFQRFKGKSNYCYAYR